MDRASPIANLHGSRWTQRINLSRATTMFWCDSDSRITHEITADGERQRWTDPLLALAHIEQRVRDSANHDACAVGFLSYELASVLEDRIVLKGAHDAPLFAFLLHSNDEDCPALLLPQSDSRNDKSDVGNPTRKAFCDAVDRAKRYIADGDVFQINLAQRFSMPTRKRVREIDEHLRQFAPADYGALIQLGNLALISNSPELFLRVTPDRQIVTQPIKGTRPRRPGMKEELRASRKDQAELAMIVDLERNDLGRICEIGSVRVTEPRAIETLPTVYHGVATIEGVLRSDIGFIELLRATFPCGSVTGAPKIRAMQIIDELEPFARGPYCGAIGYLSATGTIEFSVAIRTMIVQSGVAQVSVGGGIVADSRAEDEYEETLVKAKAMFAALGVKEIA